MTEDIKMLRAAAEAGYVPLRDYIEAVEKSALAAKLAECEREKGRWVKQFDEANADVVQLNSKLQAAAARAAAKGGERE